MAILIEDDRLVTVVECPDSGTNTFVWHDAATGQRVSSQRAPGSRCDRRGMRDRSRDGVLWRDTVPEAYRRLLDDHAAEMGR